MRWPMGSLRPKSSKGQRPTMFRAQFSGNRIEQDGPSSRTEQGQTPRLIKVPWRKSGR